MQLEAGQYFLKSLVSARGNSLLHFFKILTQMEVAFWSSEIALFKESFILAGGNGFSINYKLCAFIRNFFLLVDTMLEIMCKPNFFDFFYSLRAEAVFPASGDGFFCRMPHSGEWKQIICSVFFYSEQMLSQWKPLF